jgi:hypothetical protein
MFHDGDSGHSVAFEHFQLSMPAWYVIPHPNKRKEGETIPVADGPSIEMNGLAQGTTGANAKTASTTITIPPTAAFFMEMR